VFFLLRASAGALANVGRRYGLGWIWRRLAASQQSAPL